MKYICVQLLYIYKYTFMQAQKQRQTHMSNDDFREFSQRGVMMIFANSHNVGMRKNYLRDRRENVSNHL
jgi:hypothetical protein